MRFSLLNGILVLVFSLSTVQAQEKAGTTLLKAFGSMLKGKEKCEVSCEPVPMPRNHLASPDDAMTPSGGRLQPFGQPTYWGLDPEPASEDEGLGMLPPLPDLRTPDQVTPAEKRRNYRNTKYAVRQAENAARAEEKRLALEAQVKPTPPDPSTALIQVQSAREGASYSGNKERPTTAAGGALKPFNSGSTYTEGSEVKYKWSDNQFVETDSSLEDDGLGMLPPLPDLRTPDQVTRVERMRNRRNFKFMTRQAREEAQRREAEEAAYERNKKKF